MSDLENSTSQEVNETVETSETPQQDVATDFFKSYELVRDDDGKEELIEEGTKQPPKQNVKPEEVKQNNEQNKSFKPEGYLSTFFDNEGERYTINPEKALKFINPDNYKFNVAQKTFQQEQAEQQQLSLRDQIMEAQKQKIDQRNKIKEQAYLYRKSLQEGFELYPNSSETAIKYAEAKTEELVNKMFEEQELNERVNEAEKRQKDQTEAESITKLRSQAEVNLLDAIKEFPDQESYHKFIIENAEALTALFEMTKPEFKTKKDFNSKFDRWWIETMADKHKYNNVLNILKGSYAAKFMNHMLAQERIKAKNDYVKTQKGLNVAPSKLTNKTTKNTEIDKDRKAFNEFFEISEI